MKPIMSAYQRRVVILTALLFLVGVFIISRPQAASAHPLGNFTVNHYSRINVAVGHVGLLYILDMAEFQYVHLKGRDTKFQSKLEANGLDGMQSGYLTEASIEVHHPLNHFLIKGLQTAAIDT